jgi:hypothetical protein
MNTPTRLSRYLLAVLGCCCLTGCQWCHPCRPAYDRPFPLGQVSDSHWDAQQTNAEASDFVFYDHEFTGDSAGLTPLGEKHLQQVALRLCQVPFPVVVEQSINNKNPKLDGERRMAVIQKLAHLGLSNIDQRVVVAPAIAPGISAQEGESAYYQTMLSDGGFGGGGYGGYGGGTGGSFGGRGFGGTGGMRR